MANIKGWTLKNVKKWEGREGEGRQGNLYFAGKKVGWYNDDGNGGETDIDLDTPQRYVTLKNAAKAYFEEHPNPLYVMYGLEPDEDCLIEAILELLEKEKEFKKQQKKGFPYLFIVEDTYHWKAVGIKSEDTLEKLRKKYVSEGHQVEIYRSVADFNL